MPGRARPPVPADRHVDGAIVPAHERCERRRRPATEERAVAAGEHGRSEVRVEVVRGVPDGVDAVMHAMQVSFRDAPGDGTVVESAGDELVEPDPAVLLRRDVGHPQIGGCVETTTARDNSA